MSLSLRCVPKCGSSFPNGVDFFPPPAYSLFFPKLFPARQKAICIYCWQCFNLRLFCYFYNLHCLSFRNPFASFFTTPYSYNQIRVRLQVYTDKIEVKNNSNFIFLNYDKMEVEVSKRELQSWVQMRKCWQITGNNEQSWTALYKLPKYFVW